MVVPSMVTDWPGGCSTFLLGHFCLERRCSAVKQTCGDAHREKNRGSHPPEDWPPQGPRWHQVELNNHQ